jgi:hypothetical protein
MKHLSLVVGAVLVLAFAFPVDSAAQLRDPKIGSRPLTDADMEKYVAILTEVTKARRQIKEVSTPAGMQKIRAATAQACEAHGWGTLDYGVVDARITAAQQHIKMEKTVPIPAEKAADVALARKWADKISAARK